MKQIVTKRYLNFIGRFIFRNLVDYWRRMSAELIKMSGKIGNINLCYL